MISTDYSKIFPETSNKFSEDLTRVLDYMQDKVIKDLPGTTLGLEYFIIALLGHKGSKAYDILSDISSEVALEIIYDRYFQILSLKSVSAIKPNRQIKFSDDLVECIRASESEMKKLNEEKITTVHVLLHMMGDNTPNDKFRMALSKLGITYNSVFERTVLDNSAFGEEAKEEDEDEIKAPNPKVKIINKHTGPSLNDELLMMGLGIPKNNSKQGGIPNYCVNLNKKVKDGKIQKVVGRESEFKEMIRTLGRRKKNNVILVGGDGVGKTAICEGLAYLIENKEVPGSLIGKEVLSLDMTALIAGTSLRGMFEERVQGLLDALTKSKKYILFIDNIDSILEDKGKGDYDISAMLSTVLENGDVQIIGTASYKGFRKTFDSKPSLSRKFQKMQIEAPSPAETVNILKEISPGYEKFHKIKYTEEALEECVTLADKFITDRNLPDSAIDIMDEAGSDVNSEKRTNPECSELRRRVNEVREEITSAKRKDDYDKVDELEQLNKELVKKIIDISKEEERSREENPPVVDTDRIYSIVSEKTGIPLSKLTVNDKKKLNNIEEILEKEIIGQNEAVEIVSKSLKRNRVGFRSGRTLGSFLLLGPTGTGKTLLAKKLAKEMFGSEKALVRFDMSEYTDKTSVNKLIGANPGYVGYEEGGLMTEAIKNKKHCVMLLDEFEKADPEVYNMFLQVFDEGFLTDNTGQKIDFKNVIIILTSNVGVKTAIDFGKGIGFTEDEDGNKKRILSKELKKKFPPEFLNRLDNVVYFNSLNEGNLREIVKIEMKKLEDKVVQMGSFLKYDDSAVDFILEKIKSEKEYGARPILRAIQDEFEDRITDVILEKDYSDCHTFQILLENGEVKIY